MDSELLAKQLSGEYRVKNPGLIPLYQKIMMLVATFKRVTFSHVPRAENKLADRLAKDAVKNAPKEEPQKGKDPTKLF